MDATDAIDAIDAKDAIDARDAPRSSVGFRINFERMTCGTAWAVGTGDGC